MQVLFALFIIASSFAASAQVRELWRFDIVGNSNPSINYVAKACSNRQVGNTIVAGDRIDEFWNQKVFVRKINPAGQMLWEYVVPHAGSGSLQNRLSLEKNGNITLAVRLFDRSLRDSGDKNRRIARNFGRAHKHCLFF